MSTGLAQSGSFFTNGGMYLLAGIVAACIPIIIHLLMRLKRSPVPWGAMRFLMEVYRRHRMRLRLEQWVLLAIRCAMLVVLGLALAGPRFSGAGLTGAFSAGGSGRQICLVIDDSLSGRAMDNKTMRFERLRRMALQLLSTVDPNDRVTVWKASRPVTLRQNVLPTGPGQATRMIEGLEPGYGACELTQSLNEVSTYLAQEQGKPGRNIVVVISDFARSSIGSDSLKGGNLKRLSENATVLVSSPAEPTANVQIAQLQPRWRLLVNRSDRKQVIETKFRLRRFHTAAAGATEVEFTVTPASNKGASTSFGMVRKTYQWKQGQFEIEDRVNVLLDHVDVWDETSAPKGVAVALTARIMDPNPVGLIEDDRRSAVVKLRQQLRVGLIDQVDPSANPKGQWTPHRWAELAFLRGSGRISEQALAVTTNLSVGNIAIGELASLDAAVVLRPDLVKDADWLKIHDWVDRGGLLWVVMPFESHHRAWGARFTNLWKLEWQIDADPQVIDKQEHPEGLALDTGLAVAPLLERLSSHWQQLFQSVRVFKRVGLKFPSSSAAIWLKTNDGQPMLASTKIGQGRLCLLAVSLDDSWCNLVTRPAYIALMNETLLSSLGKDYGSLGQVGGGQDIIAGDQPNLPRPWSTVDSLVRLSPSAAEVEDTAVGRRILLERSEEGAAVQLPIEKPGIYVPVSTRNDLALAVNVDPDAGDTSSVDLSLRNQWLEALGARELSPQQAGQPLLALGSRSNGGWILLWVVLGLLLLEMILARWFSHARRTTVTGAASSGALKQVVSRDGQEGVPL